MEQILNKLSEIELTARRIMEDADRTRASLSAEMEQECKSFDAGLEQETNREIEKLRSSLEEKKNSELVALGRVPKKRSPIWTPITAGTMINWRKSCSGNL